MEALQSGAGLSPCGDGLVAIHFTGTYPAHQCELAKRSVRREHAEVCKCTIRRAAEQEHPGA